MWTHEQFLIESSEHFVCSYLLGTHERRKFFFGERKELGMVFFWNAEQGRERREVFPSPESHIFFYAGKIVRSESFGFWLGV
jgi:hypothetical protein